MLQLTAVSRTSIGVARARAVESARPDRLFDDPLARELLSQLGVEVRGLTPALQRHVALRTRLYDDQLLTSGCRQVVLLGAGLDCRACRLAWPDGTTVFELDVPPLVELKDALLRRIGAQETCRRVSLGVDLCEAWAEPLLAVGFDPSCSTAWLAEGLLVYLNGADARHVLATATALSAAGSTWASEGPPLPSGTTGAAGAVAELWRGGLGGELLAELCAGGWSCEQLSLAEIARRHGRADADEAGSTFVLAERRPQPDR